MAMRSSLRRACVLPSLLLVTVGLVACGGNGKTTVELPGGGQVEVGQEEGGITVEGPTGGQVQIGTGRYPEGWPEDFPVPEGAEPVYSVGAEDGVMVWFASDLTTDELKAFYAEALPAAGYTIDSTTEFSDAEGSYAVMTISGGGLTGGIYLGGSGSGAAPGYEGEFAFWVSLAPTD